ncbi:MAG: aspartate kinase [Eubacteriaceae bacterium]|jgi:aspartate kinase|nr:aspartate kinase [Eubacteriaceae bacterium]
MGIKVAKFGGSSVADGIQISKMRDIIVADPERRYIIVSAPGKRFEKDNKVTDLLYSCREQINQNLPIDQLFQVICDRFNSIKMNLDIDIDLQKEFDIILDHLKSNASADYVASRGEYLNAKLIAKYLGFDFVDSAEVIKFNEHGKFQDKETNAVLSAELAKHEYAVIPGFFGSRPDGRVKTFSRGGSDVTGALVARAVHADVYENWTDVSGFLAADPRIVKDPKPIHTITYKELRELSYMGANVLHESAVFPVKGAKIPINIRNTNDPEDRGTMITDEVSEEARERVITGIAGHKDFKVITIYKDRLNDEIGFLRRLSAIFEDLKIEIEHMPTGIDTVSVIVANANIDDKLDDVLDEIDRRLQPDSIDVFDDIALIATVGVGMSFRPGVSAKVFTALAEEHINIRMIDQGSSEMNIIIGVNNQDLERAIASIYDAFEGSGKDLKAHFS